MPSFVICIPVYNAEKYIERAIRSALNQDYPDYRVVLIDDASTDATWSIASCFDIEVAIRNPERLGPMLNHIKLVEQCDDGEIVVTLDGDDQLAHGQVLTRLAQAYNDPAVWVTYGSYEYDAASRNPNGDWRGISSPVSGYHNRTSGFTCSHLRTYYAWLFRRIPHDYFRMYGKYIDMAADVAIMWSLMDMTGPEHACYIHDVLYYYNACNPLNEFRVNQEKTTRIMEYLEALTPLPRMPGQHG